MCSVLSVMASFFGLQVKRSNSEGTGSGEPAGAFPGELAGTGDGTELAGMGAGAGADAALDDATLDGNACTGVVELSSFGFFGGGASLASRP